ncbi:MAG: oligosaccharide flippase family protein [Clostridiales bacterium]|nr:oligosaccharide flippase family protein [Candidatus Equinaster intestinalis]
MNKYKKLAQNTAIFAIGTFGSKILSFIMVFFYSRALKTAEFGMLDIIINTGALLLPIAMLGITNAIIRFGVDNDYKQSDVFTTGIVAVGLGFGILLLFSPLVYLIKDLREYIFILYAHILMSSLRHVCSFFVRADDKVKLYAADGIFSTFMTCALTIIFLIPLKMGIVGYMLAIILADFSSVIFLCSAGKLLKYLDFRHLDKKLTRVMIRFALPLMPTSLLWWVVNVSDRYYVKYMVGDAANGLYAVAYKVPTILTLVATIFLDAWQLSAVSENKTIDKNKFYSDVVKTFGGGVFVAGSGLILFAKFITYILLDPSYYESWRFIPVLLTATVFSCFVTFLGNVYLAQSRNVATLVTTVVGAAANLLLNYFLILRYGAQGAAIATCISYFIVFLIRAIDIKRTTAGISFAPLNVTVNSALILGQTAVMLLEPTHWVIYEILFFAAILILNLNSTLKLIKQIIKR